jgi:ABC-2 type transport system ATP-binding protein
MSVIELEGLTKDFKVGFWKKRPVRALDGLSLTVEQGEVFGFLGPNGAGKTTTLKLLMNLLHPTAGTARILGQPVGNVSMRERIGYLPENPYFYDYLTASEFLTYAGSLFGIASTELRTRVKRLLESVGLAGASNVQLRKFSKGMVQRIGIAQALINDPKVVFLDEPMSGLDPLGRRDVREVVASLRSKGVTVFFSSHILPDVEALCDRVAIMHKGKLRRVGALTDILEVEVVGFEVILTGSSPQLVERLRDLSDEQEAMGDRLRLRVSTARRVQEVLERALPCGGGLISVNPIRPSLEDHFLREVASA